MALVQIKLDSEKLSVVDTTIFKEYKGYSKGYTLNGFISYYYHGKRIAKKIVPSDILEHLPSDRELAFTSIEERRIKSGEPYTGFSYLLSQNRKIYMFNNNRIPKRIIKDEEFEVMYDRQRKWQEGFKNYFNKKYNQPKKDPKSDSKYKEKTKYEKEIPTNDFKPKEKIYSNMSPYELLKYYGINTKKDWRKWMLKNHPDKDPDTDLELVKLINMAAKMMFD